MNTSLKDLFLYLIYDYKLILIVFFIIFTFKLIFASLSKYLKQKNRITFTETSLPKNMTLHRFPVIHSNQQNDKKPKTRPLALIFAWLLAEDKHLVKYRQLWFKRGFDVLIVKISPLGSLIPPLGSLKIAEDVVNVLSQLNSEYNEVVVQGFSAGAYHFGEVLVYLFGTSPEEHSVVIQSIKGVIMDSIVATVDVPSGMATTLTNSPKLRSVIETTINLIIKILYNITAKHYENSGETFINPKIKCPGLIFYSRDDVISNYKNIEKMIQKRRELGHDIRVKCWDVSGHVQHYKEHPMEYEEEVDSFLKSLNLKNYFLNEKI